MACDAAFPARCASSVRNPEEPGFPRPEHKLLTWRKPARMGPANRLIRAVGWRKTTDAAMEPLQ
ncbi:MAG: hypothetical protein OJF60_001271 [Burkholderiaceae bacterium]|nr:MAG: hypothetical protein OJF60_001271 [Burkholderiaceae bacterium]